MSEKQVSRMETFGVGELQKAQEYVKTGANGQLKNYECRIETIDFYECHFEGTGHSCNTVTEKVVVICKWCS